MDRINIPCLCKLIRDIIIGPLELAFHKVFLGAISEPEKSKKESTEIQFCLVDMDFDFGKSRNFSYFSM